MTRWPRSPLQECPLQRRSYPGTQRRLGNGRIKRIIHNGCELEHASCCVQNQVYAAKYRSIPSPSGSPSRAGRGEAKSPWQLESGALQIGAFWCCPDQFVPGRSRCGDGGPASDIGSADDDLVNYCFTMYTLCLSFEESMFRMMSKVAGCGSN